MKGKGIFKIILFVAIAAMIVLMFYIVAQKLPSKAADSTEVSEVKELMYLDIDGNYPATPREVLRLYNRYLRVIYGSDGDDISENDLKRLASKIREMYDWELLEANPEDTYFIALISEVNSFKSDNKVMLKTNVSASVEFDYYDRDGEEFALGTADYFVKQGSDTFTRTYEEYLFRKGEDGRWKILAFRQTDGD
ncbi:MAG: hypothetical protein K6E56_03105 [Lachnospiraceae bacterium]|nr:hypothetical protein [Lachnospiraceae bacterium]